MKKILLIASIFVLFVLIIPIVKAVTTQNVTVQGTVDTEISLTVDSVTSTLVMGGGHMYSLPGSAYNGTSTTTWTVTGGSAIGWNLRLKTASGYAGKLCKGGTGGCADANKTFAALAAMYYGDNMNTAAAAAQFGFSINSANYAATAFLDNGSSTCGAGSFHANKCWSPLSDSDLTIATNSAPTVPAGEATVTTWRVEKGSTKYLEASTTNGYYTLVTGTANAL